MVITEDILKRAQSLNEIAETLSARDIISLVYENIEGEKVLSMSLQAEDILIAHYILNSNMPLTIYSLDTGRLHPETYQMIDRLRERFKINLKIYSPSETELEKLTTASGMYSFKNSPEQRKQCCHIRKVEPNRRALKNAAVWFTGIRRDMSEERRNTPIIQFEPELGLVKVSPLANTTRQQVLEETDIHKLPLHPLYAKGFRSIGCEPCTRAISDEEDERAGRWWWESSDHKECGLHLGPPLNK